MAEFKPEEMDDLDQDTFDSLRKDDLITLANFLKVEVKRSMRKREIQFKIAKHLVKSGHFEESALKDYEPESTSELRKLELEMQTNLEIKKLELQMREKELQMEERQREKDRQERLEMEERQKERELEMKEKELQMEERQREKEREEKEKERELAEHRLQLEMRRLELRKSGKFFPSDKFDITKHFRLVPPFQEKDVDKYFLHFEKIAQSLNWPKESWSMLLQSALVGKAREIYIQLSVEQASDYDSVKELILKGYELVPEAYRQKFRDCEKVKDQTYVEFARTKEQLFDRWCSSEKVSQNYDKLRQLVLIEEFKRCIRSDIKTFINEQKADTLEVAARLADDYSLTHKSSFLSKPSQSFSYRNNAGKFNSSFSSKNFSKDSRNQMTTVHRVQVTLPHHQIPSLNLLLTNSSVHFLVIIVRKTAI
ncbi:reticulocyte-binding protein homolog 2a-like [Ptychodera flava]|uniref:reticulocyte-binding protein homolog 2a-like n=1 Tax=Ptychodera flava TaxID=63121 RepID=UPI00396A4BAB